MPTSALSKTTIAILLTAIVSWSFAGEPDMATVLEKHYQAVGGKKLAETVKTIHIEGTAHAEGKAFPFKVMKTDKLQIRMEWSVEGQLFVQAFDGKKGWQINPLTGSSDPVPMGEKESREICAFADLVNPLVGWKEKGYTVDYQGLITFNEKPVYSFEVVRPGLNTRTVLLDPETFLVHSYVDLETVKGEEQMIINSYTDWTTIEPGLKYPTTGFRHTPSCTEKMKMKFTRIILNQKVSDTLFTMPGTNTLASH